VLDSIARGVPTVLSNVAAEGTGLVHGFSTLIATTPESWVAQILRLLEDEDLWGELSKNSLELVRQRYSKAHGYECFSAAFNSVGLEFDSCERTNYRKVLVQ